MIKNYIILFYFLATSLFCFAQPPLSYYTSSTLDGKNTVQLQTAMKSIITSGHSVVSYNNLWNAYDETDLKPNGKIWDMYSNCDFTYSTNQCGTFVNECDCYNREHSVPASWYNDAAPMYSDLFNVYPTDGKVNGLRSNFPYGEVTNPTNTSGNGSKVGPNVFAGYNGTVFEPIDEYKGDFARTYFYMATRYADICAAWGNGVFGNTHLGLTTYGRNLLLDWSRNDPVSQKEIDRNIAVSLKQFNRNPFIDFPGLEEFIWGNQTTELFYVAGPPVTLPNVVIIDANNITTHSAILNAEILDLGNGTITQAGFFLSTINGFANGQGILYESNQTELGVFSENISGLSPSTTYFFKAFATNSAGTTYTNQETLTTSLPVPTGPSLSAVKTLNSGSNIAFGNVNTTATKNLLIQTANINGNLSVVVNGNGFSSIVNTISIVQANAGFLVPIVFAPTNSGMYSGTITISGGGLSQEFVSNLTGSKP